MICRLRSREHVTMRKTHCADAAFLKYRKVQNGMCYQSASAAISSSNEKFHNVWTHATCRVSRERQFEHFSCYGWLVRSDIRKRNLFRIYAVCKTLHSKCEKRILNDVISDEHRAAAAKEKHFLGRGVRVEFSRSPRRHSATRTLRIAPNPRHIFSSCLEFIIAREQGERIEFLSQLMWHNQSDDAIRTLFCLLTGEVIIFSRSCEPVVKSW